MIRLGFPRRGLPAEVNQWRMGNARRLWVVFRSDTAPYRKPAGRG